MLISDYVSARDINLSLTNHTSFAHSTTDDATKYNPQAGSSIDNHGTSYGGPSSLFTDRSSFTGFKRWPFDHGNDSLTSRSMNFVEDQPLSAKAARLEGRNYTFLWVLIFFSVFLQSLY